MVFQYVACAESGQIMKGSITAASEDAVSNMLSYAGYRVISLKPTVSFFDLGKLSSHAVGNIRPSEIILFYRQLALLLESGVSITMALDLLRGQSANSIMKKVLGDVIMDLRNGNQLSAALSRHPKIFSNICCRSISIGEQSGGLEQMLRQIADFIEKETVTRKSIKGALTYPVIAAVVAVVVVGVLVGFVLPAFGKLYESLGVQLPALTRLILDFSAGVRNNGLLILLALLITVLLVSAYLKTADGKYQLDKLKLRMPTLGRVNHLNELARCCRSIALLFRAGLPLTEILPMIVQSSTNRVVSKALVEVQEAMFKGEGLSRPMSHNSIFMPMLVQMVKVGEETGNLDTTLLSVAQSYETEAEDKTKAFIALIQPALTVAIALVVGVIALSLVSAMYSIYGQTF